jgi:hypothetical protein
MDALACGRVVDGAAFLSVFVLDAILTPKHEIIDAILTPKHLCFKTYIQSKYNDISEIILKDFQALWSQDFGHYVLQWWCTISRATYLFLMY